MIARNLKKRLESRLFKGKAILVLGARQVGKTCLMKDLLAGRREKVLWLDGDDPDVEPLLTKAGSTRLRSLVGQARLVCIDEAQKIREIGLVLKRFVDHLPDVQVLATGSSAFELANQAGEPLTGRKYEFHLFPLAFGEMSAAHGRLEEKRLLEHRLVFGMYPEIVSKPGEEIELLRLLASSYLFKDVLMLEQIRKPHLLEKLVRALAWQIGCQVSSHEVGQTIGADSTTVEKYIDILERAFVIFRLPAFSRNLRNELRKSRKIYFWDNGIRNAVIGNFQLIGQRADVGALWENFLVSERRKWLSAQGSGVSSYFWRTTQQQEIDYLEDSGTGLSAWEFKWNPRARVRFPKTFLNAYDLQESGIVSPDTFDSFLDPEEG